MLTIEERKYLLSHLCVLLVNQVDKFMNENMPNGGYAADILTIVVSAHISSLKNCLATIQEAAPKHQHEIDRFIKGLSVFISNSFCVESVETFPHITN